MRSVLLALWVLHFIPVAGESGLFNKTIVVDNIVREYIVYLPKGYDHSKKFRLILAFHGGGGTARKAVGLYNFNPLADREGFIVVYPNGIDRSWNDGRIAPKKSTTANDVKFVSLLIDKLQMDYSIDSDRIFSTGLSNGAIFSIYLAWQLPGKILAIAPVSGSLPVDIEKEFHPMHPVSALFINGTDDKLVRYGGGPVLSKNAGRGEVIGIEKLVSMWIGFNDCSGDPKIIQLPDIDSHDHCTASQRTYSLCRDSAEVNFIKVNGGGHTWPGGRQYLPKFIIGNVCRDFKAEEVIWEFFKRQ